MHAVLNKGWVLALALMACGPNGPPPEEEQPGPEDTLRVLSAAGEFPSMNELTAPQGAALRAVNVVVDNQDEYTTHRGIQKSPAGEHAWSSMTVWQGAVIAHSQEDGVLARLEGGVWTTYPGLGWSAPPGERMSFFSLNGALFFTTVNGLYRLDSVAGEPVASGLPQGLAGTASLTDSSGYLDAGYTVAYRHSWAINVEANGEERLIEGAPSQRLLVNNPTATAASRDVSIVWPIPDDLPAGAYNRTFRSDAALETISPTDEVRQVYEREPTAAERTARTFTFTDNTPDVLKGPGAYYAANTGEGIAQSNYHAALLHSLTAFNDSMFGVTVDGVHALTLTLVGTGTGGLQAGDTLYLTRGDTVETYTAGNSEVIPSTYQVFTSGTPAQNVANTIASLIRCLNGQVNGMVLGFALDTDGTRPGALLIQSRTVDQTPIVATQQGASRPWLPDLRAFTGSGPLSRTSGVVTAVTSTPHGFSVNDDIEMYYRSDIYPPDPNFPAGTFVVASVPNATTFTYAQAGEDVLGVNASYFFRDSGSDVQSTSGTALNAYAWAKQGEPDHWPLNNLGAVGNAQDTLWWGQPLDRFLFLGSTSGLYRLQGNAPTGFSLMDNGVWDSTTSFLGRRTVAALDGKGFAISNKGLVVWTEGSKPESADIPIQDEIRSLVASIPNVIAEYGFLFADAINHRLYVCLPQQSTDTAATVCHILSTRTGAWTRLDNTFPGFEQGWVWGMAPPEQSGTLYTLAPLTSEDRFSILSSRNTYTDADYQGPDGEGIPAKVTYLPLIAGEPERFKQWTWTRVFTKAPTTKLTVCFASEWQPAEECQLLPDIDPVYTGYEPISDPVRGIAWRTIADKFRQRAKSLTVAVGHNIPQQPLHLLGLEVKHRAYGAGQ